MKPTSTFRRFLLSAGSPLLCMSLASAGILYWDGGTINIGTDGNGLSGGTTGNWNTALTNWDAGPSAHVAWVNANLDTAIFGGTGIAGNTVTLTAPITVGGLTFYSSSYVINAGVQGLTFGATNNTVSLFNTGNVATAAATITGTVAGNNMIFTSANPVVASTMTFNGTSAGGWTGTTTINPGMTLALAASSQALLDTTGITLNGGTILLTNTATGSENTINRVSDSAAIASYGNGTISIANTATASRAYTEDIGAITHYNGQLSLGFATNQNQASNTQTLMVGGLTRSGSTSTIAISNGGSGALSIGANSNIRINGVTSSTAAGQIIGPWMTAGSLPTTQSDWAVYNSDGVSGRVQSAAIAASAQGTWISTTGNYTSATTAPTASPVNSRLTGDRFVNTLRATYGETTNAGNWTFDLANEKVLFASHNLSDGDVVQFRSAPVGLTDNRPYYVINAAAGEFKLSLTPGGAAVDLTNAAAGFMSTGLNLNGNTLGTNGFIVGTTGSASIGGGSASTLTLPTTATGNLYLHGASNIWIDPSIKDNGAGVLTLVKGSTNTVSLSGDNTYSGGTVINAGTVNFMNAGSWVSGQNITFGGTGTIAPSTAVTGGALTVNQGAVGTIVGNATVTFASASGSGTLVVAPSGSSGIVDLGDASGFTGTLQARLTGNHNIALGSNNQIQFTRLADTAGSALQFVGGQSDGQQDMRIALYGDGGQLTFNNRQIQLLPRTASNHTIEDSTLVNNNTNAAHTWVINTDLLMASTSSSPATIRYLTLSGSNTGDNAFNGLLPDGDHGVHPLGLRKTGSGRWIVSANNTFTGDVTVSGGTLVLSGTNQYTSATTVTSGGTLSVNSVSDYGVASAIGKIASGAAILLGTGSGQTGTLEYTGSGHETNRQVQIGSIGAASGNGVILNNGTGALIFDAPTFNVNDSTAGGSGGSRNLTLGGSYTGGVNEIQGAILANTGNPTARDIAIIKNDVSTWSFAGANTYTGGNSTGNTINLGTLRGTQTSGTPFGTGAVTINGGTLSLAPTGSGANVAVTGGTRAAGTLFTYNADAMLSLARGSQTSLTYTFGGTGANTARGTNGTLILSTSDIANFGAAGGNLERFIMNGTAPPQVNTLVSGVLIQDRNNSNAGDFAAYDGTHGYTKATYTLTNDFTGSDNTSLVDISSATATSGATAAYALKVNGTTLTNTGNTITLGNGSNPAALILNGGTISGGTLSKPNSSEYLIYTSGASVISSTITSGTGSTGMSVFGPGSLDLTGSTNDVAGNLRINNSTVIATDNNQLGNSTSQINLVGGTLQTSGTFALGGAGQRTITLAAGQDQTGGTFNVTGGITTYENATSGSKIMSGSGSLTKTGSGSLALMGNTANTYTGATNVNVGTLEVGGTASINSTASINVAAGATFLYNSSTALTVGPSLNGTGTGAGQRAILGGTGPINTAITLNNLGDVLSPGNSPGIQGYTVNQSWASFSYDWELNDWAASVAGTNIDQIGITGALELTGSSASSYQFNILSLTGGNVSGDVPNFAETSKSWTILTASGGITGFDASYWNIINSGFTSSPSATGTWSLTQSGNDLVLNYSAVPEPRAALLAGLGALMLLRRRR